MVTKRMWKQPKNIFCSMGKPTTSRTGLKSSIFLVHTHTHTLYGPNAKLALVFPGAVTRSCLLLPRPALKMLDTSSWFCTPLGTASPKPFLVTTRFSLGGKEEKKRGKKVVISKVNTSQRINCIFTRCICIAGY